MFDVLGVCSHRAGDDGKCRGETKSCLRGGQANMLDQPDATRTAAQEVTMRLTLIGTALAALTTATLLAGPANADRPG